MARARIEGEANRNMCNTVDNAIGKDKVDSGRHDIRRLKDEGGDAPLIGLDEGGDGGTNIHLSAEAEGIELGSQSSIHSG